MKLTITLLICIASITATAQTKRIAFASHGGDPENLGVTMDAILFNSDNSNFGMAPERLITTASLDSVIYISEDIAVMVTSTYCKRQYSNAPAKLWKPGKDTVYHHGLFSQKHSLDSIRMVLEREYNFQNSIKTTKFIGYDNGEDSVIINNSETQLKKNLQQNTNAGFGSIIVLLLSASIIAGFFSKMLNKRSA